MRFKTVALVAGALFLSTAVGAQDQVQQSLPQWKSIDPSENVKALATADAKRGDDLRAITNELVNTKIKALEDIAALQFKLNEELRIASTNALRREAELRAEFNTAIAATEKARVDAIRLVDKNAVDVATAQAGLTAAALQKTVTETAEVQRVQTARSTEELRATFTQGLAQVTTRIAALEQGSAEGRGKQTYQDPAIANAISSMALQIEKVSRLQADAASVGSGRGDVVGWIVGAVGLLGVILAGIVSVVVITRSRRPA